MWVNTAVLLPACAIAPATDHMFYDPLHGLCIVVLGAEVPAFGESLALGVEMFRQC